MMTDDDVGKALRQLPRATASPRFKSDALRAIRDQQRPRIGWRLVTATAMMLLLVMGTYGASQRLHRKQRMREVRAELPQIRSELHRVKAIASETQPVVILENGDTRLIVANQQSKPIYY